LLAFKKEVQTMKTQRHNMSTGSACLTTPFKEEEIRALKAGDIVSITGTIYTGRDKFHKYIAEGNNSPVDLENSAIYHCGPVMVKNAENEWTVRAAGPTTSIREEPYMADVIKSTGIRCIIGKGGMKQNTQNACREFGAVYLQAIGGAASLLASYIKKVPNVFLLEEFGMAEAVWELQVENFEAIVTMDAHGESLHEKVDNDSKSKLQETL
jgi:fumarate hydratase class I